MKIDSFKHLMSAAGLCLVAALAACGGGGGNAGTSVFDTSASAVSGPTAADLIVETSSASITNSGADSVTITVTAVDNNRQTVAEVPIVIAADSNAVISSTSTTTDNTGKLVATLTVGADRSNRTITVTVTSGSVTKTKTVNVTGAKLTSTANPALVVPQVEAKIEYTLVDVLGKAIPNQAITVTGTGITSSGFSGTTDASGVYVFKYTLPASATGSVEIVAQAGGASSSQVIQVDTGGVAIPDAVGTISTTAPSANPSVVSVNQAGSFTNGSTIRAQFIGANNAPIKNVRVKFDLNGDAQSIGGTFSSSGTATGSKLYSNENGIVTDVYRPGTRSSPTNGVTVRACYGATDAAVDACTTSANVSLTIISEPLGVTIGTNGSIEVGTLTYSKRFVITVVNASGQAMAGVDIAAFLDLFQYRKGYYTLGASAWLKTTTQTCAAEDINRNGVIDPLDDVNNSGRLEPRNSDASIQLLQTKTRDDGTAELLLTYPQNFASWIDAKITVSATGVSGSEGRDNFLVVPLPVPATVLTTTTSSPAFVTSPYGITSSGTSVCSVKD